MYNTTYIYIYIHYIYLSLSISPSLSLYIYIYIYLCVQIYTEADGGWPLPTAEESRHVLVKNYSNSCQV